MISSTKTTLQFFGIYVLLAGITTAIAPEIIYALMFLEFKANNLHKVISILAIVIGTYYLNATRGDCRIFAEGSVIGRLIVVFASIGFVLLGKLEWNWLLIFSIDALGLVWTAVALRSEEE